MRAALVLSLSVILVAGISIWKISSTRTAAPGAAATAEETPAKPAGGPLLRSPGAAEPTGTVVSRAQLGVTVSRPPTPGRTVHLRDIPAGVYDPDNQFDRGKKRGRMELPVPQDLADQLRSAARRAPASPNVQTSESASTLAPTSGTGWDSLDYLDCCGGGGNVPPDPELAVGPDHVIAVVNVAFEIYDKNGTSLVGPTTFSSFMASDSECTGVFDPNAIYDEQADRFILAIDADGTDYCVAVSQTGDPTGAWYIYSFDTVATKRDFFDYPHAGVGRDAIYMGANIFRRNSFYEARVYALDKNAMYAGQSAGMVSIGLGSAHDTPQPLHLHGWAQGTWPTSGPHYFLAETDYNGADHTVFAWNAPFGANTFSTVGTIDLNAASGVTAGFPLDVPQQGGSNLQGNDWRPQDFEYRNGYAWTAMTVACNPGGGTVNCVRWAQIDPASASVVQAGVYGSNAEYRIFPDLAVNACNDMAVGYTKSGTGLYPGIWTTGRESGDPAGQLQAEALVQPGEIAYTAFDSVPRRWGDYTEMTIDPDGQTFWYLGEYSKNTGSTNGRWGTFISAFSFGGTCGGGPTDTPPSVSLTSPSNGSTVSGTISVTATAGDDNGVDEVEFFVDSASLGVDTNGADGWSVSWDTTGSGNGSHTVTATATDTANQTDTDSVSVTVDNGTTSASVHIGDLDGSSANQGRRWRATVFVAARDDSGDPVSAAVVTAQWSEGTSGTGTCTTDGSGNCNIRSDRLDSSIASVRLTVTDVAATGLTYDPGSNTDPDGPGDSDGTTIVVSRP